MKKLFIFTCFCLTLCTVGCGGNSEKYYDVVFNAGENAMFTTEDASKSYDSLTINKVKENTKFSEVKQRLNQKLEEEKLFLYRGIYSNATGDWFKDETSYIDDNDVITDNTSLTADYHVYGYVLLFPNLSDNIAIKDTRFHRYDQYIYIPSYGNLGVNDERISMTAVPGYVFNNNFRIRKINTSEFLIKDTDYSYNKDKKTLEIKKDSIDNDLSIEIDNPYIKESTVDVAGGNGFNFVGNKTVSIKNDYDATVYYSIGYKIPTAREITLKVGGKNLVAGKDFTFTVGDYEDIRKLHIYKKVLTDDLYINLVPKVMKYKVTYAEQEQIIIHEEGDASYAEGYKALISGDEYYWICGTDETKNQIQIVLDSGERIDTEKFTLIPYGTYSEYPDYYVLEIAPKVITGNITIKNLPILNDHIKAYFADDLTREKIKITCDGAYRSREIKIGFCIKTQWAGKFTFTDDVFKSENFSLSCYNLSTGVREEIDKSKYTYEIVDENRARIIIPEYTLFGDAYIKLFPISETINVSCDYEFFSLDKGTAYYDKDYEATITLTKTTGSHDSSAAMPKSGSGIYVVDDDGNKIESTYTKTSDTTGTIKVNYAVISVTKNLKIMGDPPITNDLIIKQGETEYEGTIVAFSDLVRKMYIPKIGYGPENKAYDITKIDWRSSINDEDPPKVKSISGGERLTSISDESFKNFTSLETVNLNDAGHTMNVKGLFNGCTKLKTVVTNDIKSNDYTEIAENLFNGCTSLDLFPNTDDSFVVPGTVTTIGDGAFSNWDTESQLITFAKQNKDNLSSLLKAELSEEKVEDLYTLVRVTEEESSPCVSKGTRIAIYKPLSEYSWEQINTISENGFASHLFNICDETRKFEVDGTSYSAHIIGFDHDTIYNSEKKAGITFEFTTLYKDDVYFGGDERNSCYYYEGYMSGLYKKLNDVNYQSSVYNLLPKDMSKYIKQVSKSHSRGNGYYSQIISSPNYLFPLSVHEIDKTYIDPYYYFEGSVYPYYDVDDGLRLERLKKSNANSNKIQSYWLRSPYEDESSVTSMDILYFNYSKGKIDKMDIFENELFFCPAFCI